MIRRRLAPFLVVLLVLPLASAGGGGTLQAHSVALLQAEGSEAELAVLLRTAGLDTPAAFELRASSLRVETDQRALWTDAAGTPVSSSRTDHGGARLVGQAARPDGRLFVVPHGDVLTLEAPEASCGRAEPAPQERFVYVPRLAGRTGLSVPLAGAVAWAPCTDAAVTLHGDLLLVLWDWDARLTSDQGTSALRSGRGDATGGDAGAREQFLFARNATLALPAGRQTAYVENLTATADSVRLGGAEGRLDGSTVDGDLRLSGRVEVLVQGRGAGEPMAVTVDGTLHDALVGGMPLGASAGGLSWWPWLLAGAGAVGVVRVRPHLHYLHAERTGGELGSLVPQTLRQRRAVGLWIMARGAEGRRWFRACHRRATRANDLFRPFPEAQFTRAVAAAALGRHADAMTDFIDLYHR